MHLHAHTEQNTCNAPVPHHLRRDQWTTHCHNPSEAKCYKCDRFYCCNHIRKHDCDGVEEHPASD
ncbi:MAG TPA: hypothetical protein VGL89_03875 [Candidatus Koribacter sp.]